MLLNACGMHAIAYNLAQETKPITVTSRLLMLLLTIRAPNST
jgi:hypothetical protein